jgi:ribosome-interacting GTPase 1
MKCAICKKIIAKDPKSKPKALYMIHLGESENGGIDIFHSKALSTIQELSHSSCFENYLFEKYKFLVIRDESEERFIDALVKNIEQFKRLEPLETIRGNQKNDKRLQDIYSKFSEELLRNKPFEHAYLVVPDWASFDEGKYEVRSKR